MITLYGFGRVHEIVHGVTRDLRVQWALEETGLPYKVQALDHTGGEVDREPFYGKINPFGIIPVIDDDGFILTESGAILLYLAEKSGKLMPKDFHGRMHVAQWCFSALTTVELPLSQIWFIDHSGELNDSERERRQEMVEQAESWFKDLDGQLENRQWIAGDDFTVADILMATVLRQIRETNLMNSYPRLKDYYQRALARPAWQRTLELYAKRVGSKVEDIL